jgi:glucose/arabinose dehydrogenase
VAAFPAHWAPLAIAFYTGTQFPSSYRGGAFIAFHGSWNRSPLPQEGYRIVFVPFDGTNPTGDFTTFASLAGAPTGLRASGVAVGPDGSLYIAADRNGKIWRIFYGS